MNARSARQLHAPHGMGYDLRDLTSHAAIGGSACKRLSGARLQQCGCQQPKCPRTVPFPDAHTQSQARSSNMLRYVTWTFIKCSFNCKHQRSPPVVRRFCTPALKNTSATPSSHSGCASVGPAELPCLCAPHADRGAKAGSPMHRRVKDKIFSTMYRAW